MRFAYLKVQESQVLPGFKSVRSVTGGDPRWSITAAGFEEDEKVVLVAAADLLSLLEQRGRAPLPKAAALLHAPPITTAEVA